MSIDFKRSSPVVARQLIGATLLLNGRVLIAGGSGLAGSLNNTELYTP